MIRNDTNSYWQHGGTGSSTMYRPSNNNVGNNFTEDTGMCPVGQGQGQGPGTPGMPGTSFGANPHDQVRPMQYPVWTQSPEIRPSYQPHGHCSHASSSSSTHINFPRESQGTMPSFPPPPLFQPPAGQHMMPGPSYVPFPSTNQMHQVPPAPQMPNMMHNTMDRTHTPTPRSESGQTWPRQGNFGDRLSSDLVNKGQQWFSNAEHTRNKHGDATMKPSTLIPYQSRHSIRHENRTSSTSENNLLNQGRNKNLGMAKNSHGFDPSVSAFARKFQTSEGQINQRERVQMEDSIDQKWVTNWLKGVKKKQPPVKTMANRPLLADSRLTLVKYLKLLNQLKEKRDAMSECLLTEMDEEKWQHHCNQMHNMTKELSTIQAKVSDSAFVSGLQEMVERNWRKRERARRCRRGEWEMREDHMRRQRERVDGRMAAALQAKQEKEREGDLQKEVDNALSEVRRKKQDATKTLELLRGLRKLRHLRKETAEKKGHRGQQGADVAFESKISELEDMMNKQKLLYVEEERALQVMLEEEHEETRERERQKKCLQEQRKAERALEARIQMIFGKDEALQPGHPLFIFRQYYQQAENSLQSLVNIRHQWDLFLIPDSDPSGSSVPVTWVVPPEPANHIWATAREDPTGS